MATPKFEGNSFKSRESSSGTKLMLSPVVKEKPTIVKKRKRLFDYLYTDPNKTFKEYIIQDLVVPNAQRAIGAILHGVVTKLFGVGVGNVVSDAYRYTNGWFNSKPYTPSSVSFYSQSQNMPTQNHAPQNQPQATTDLMSYSLRSREDAERVLEGLGTYIDTYDVVPVSAFFELIGVQAPYTYHDFGWNSLVEARVVPVENGWSIRFPKPIRIK